MEIISAIASTTATLGLAGLMFTIGLSLVPSDFLRVGRYPLAVGLGLLGQIILLPLVAFLISIYLELSPTMALGLMIISACPGGPTSNAFSVIAKADIALSVTLTAVSSILAFLTVPAIVNVSISYFGYGEGSVSMSFIDTAQRVFLTTALPLFGGMIAAEAIRGERRERFSKVLFVTSLVCIIVPSVGLIITQRNVLLGQDLAGAFSAPVLNIIMILVGLMLGLIARLPGPQAKTISVEVGVQNFGLAFVIIHTFLDDTNLLIPGLFYLPSMLILGFLTSHLFSLSLMGNAGAEPVVLPQKVNVE